MMRTCSGSCFRGLVGGSLGSHSHVMPARGPSALGCKRKTSSPHGKGEQTWSFIHFHTPLCHFPAHPERPHGAGPAGVDGGEGFPPEAAVSRRAGPEGQRGAAQKVREGSVAAGHGGHLAVCITRIPRGAGAPEPTVRAWPLCTGGGEEGCAVLC